MRARSCLALAAVAAVGAGTLAGCSADPGETPDVSIYVFGYDSGMDQWVEDTTAAFDDLDLGYSLDITVVPPNDLQQTLTTRLQGGTPPDITSAPTAWIPAYADSLRDLSTILSPDLAEGFAPTVEEQATFDDRLVAAPYGTSTRALYYNKDLFAAAGIDEPPATWDELISDAQAVKASSGLDAGIGVQGTGNETFAAWFPYVYWSFGGDFGTGDTIELDPDACLSGLEVLDDIVRGSAVSQPNPTSSDLTDIQDSFASGQTAMTISGPWLLGSLGDLSAGVAPIPAGSTQSTLAVADAWTSFAGSTASDEQVGQVLDFLLSSDVEIPFLQGRGFLPSLERDFTDPAFQGEEFAPFVQALDTAKFAPLSDQWAQFQVTGESAMQSLYVGDQTPEQVCATLADSLT